MKLKSCVFYTGLFSTIERAVNRSHKSWTTTNHSATRILLFGFCIFLELLKFGYGESMVWCVRPLEKLYFICTYTVDDFIAFSAYAVDKHKSLCPLFCEYTCKRWGENTRILRSQSAHRCLDFACLPLKWPKSSPWWVSESHLESFVHPGWSYLTLSQTASSIFSPEGELQILEHQSTLEICGAYFFLWVKKKKKWKMVHSSFWSYKFTSSHGDRWGGSRWN